MNAEIKKEWVRRLRSGEYEQTVSRLRVDDEGYCCMGVLCDILDPEGWEKVGHGDWEWKGAGTELMHAELEEIGLTDKNQNLLVRKNDGHKGLSIKKHSFSEIADHIEAHL